MPIRLDTDFEIIEERIDIDTSVLKKFKESVVERAAMEYFKGLGYTPVFGTNIEDIDYFERSGVFDIDEVDWKDMNKTKPFVDIIKKVVGKRDLDKIKSVIEMLHRISPASYRIGRGIPDLIVMNERTKEFFFCEVKSETDELRTKQALFKFFVEDALKICKVRIVRINGIPRSYRFNLRSIIESDTNYSSNLKYGIRSHSLENYTSMLSQVTRLSDKINYMKSNSHTSGKLENTLYSLFCKRFDLAFEFFSNIAETFLKSGTIDMDLVEKTTADKRLAVRERRILVEKISKKLLKRKKFVESVNSMEKRSRSNIYYFLKEKYGYNKKLSQDIFYFLQRMNPSSINLSKPQR